MRKLVCILVGILCLFSSALAYEPITAKLESYEVGEGNILVYFNSNTDVAEKQVKVTLGGETLPIQSLERFGETKNSMTFMFLADISGSIKEDRLTAMKEIMTGFADKMGAEDNGCVMTIGNSSNTNPFVSDKQSLKQQIDSVARTSEDTNLFASIVKALGILNTSEAVHTKKCLIVLSDGQDDFIEGYTREEVEKSIEQSHMPVYTVAMLESKSSDKTIDSAKILGSFARLSAGGLDQTLGLDQTTTSDVTNNIKESIDNSYLLNADFSALKEVDDQGTLQINLTVDGQGAASDGYAIDTADIKAQLAAKNEESPVPSETEAATETPQASDAPDIVDETPKDMTLVIVLASAGGAVLIAAVIIIILSASKRKKKPAESVLPPSKEEIKVSAKQAPTAVAERALMELKFTKVGLVEGDVFTYRLRDQMIIGRSSKANLVFAKDELLSGQHSKIYLKDNKLYIEDLHSTNGTYVNGVPLDTPRILEQDDIVMLGSMELRINWKE